MATTKDLTFGPSNVSKNNAKFNKALKEFEDSKILPTCIDFGEVSYDLNAVELKSCSSCVKKVKLLQKLSLLNEENGTEIIELALEFINGSQCFNIVPQALLTVDLGLEKALSNFTTNFTQSMKECFRGVTDAGSEMKSSVVEIWNKIKPYMTIGFGLVAFLVVFATVKVSYTIVKDTIAVVKFLAKNVLPPHVYDYVFVTDEKTHHVVLNDNNLDGNSFVEQSFCNWHGYIFRLVTIILSGFSVNLASKYFASNSVAKYAIGDMTSMLPSFIDDVLAYFKLPFVFNTSIPDTAVCIIKRLMSCVKLLQKWDFSRGFKGPQIVEFFSVVKDYEYMRDRFMTNKKVSDYIHNFSGEYKMVHDFVLSLKQSENRMEPIVVYLAGAPGCGKSSMYGTLTQILAGVCYSTTEHKASTWTYTEGLKHFDGYKNQEIVVVDDAFQTKDSESAPNTLVADLIRMVNTSSYNLPMAHLDNKGTTYFTSDFILATSNTTTLGTNIIKSISCVKALIRRMSFPYKMTLKIKMLPGETVFAYINKIESQWPRDEQFTQRCLDLRDSIWDFQRLDLTNGQLVGPILDFSTFIDLILTEYNNKKNNVVLASKNAITDFSHWNKFKEQSGIFTNLNHAFDKVRVGYQRMTTPHKLNKLRDILKQFHLPLSDVDEILKQYYKMCSKGCDFPLGENIPYAVKGDNEPKEWSCVTRENKLFFEEMRDYFQRAVKEYDFSFIEIDSEEYDKRQVGETLFNLIYEELANYEPWEQMEMHECFTYRNEYTISNIISKYIKPIVAGLTILLSGITLYKMLSSFGNKNKKEEKVNDKSLAKELEEKLVNMKTQGANMSSESLISFLSSKLKKNTLRFCFVTKEGSEEYEHYLGYCIIPKTNVVIFPYHFLKNTLANKDAYKIRCYFISINPLETDKKAFEVHRSEFETWKQYHRLYNTQLLPTDLVIVNMVTGDVRDITNQFFTNAELSKGFNNLSTANSMHLVVKPIGQNYGIQFMTVGNFNSYVDSWSYGNPNVAYSHLVLYNMPTKFGDCGGSVIVNCSEGFKVVGSHTAGDNSTRAMCAIITQEDINFVVNKYNNFCVSTDIMKNAGLIKKQNNYLNAQSGISRYPVDMVPKLDYTIQKFPAKLNVWIDEQGNKRSPMKEAQVRYQECPVNYSLDVIGSDFFDDVAGKIVPLNSSHKIFDRIWTFEEAVVGRPGIRFFDSLNRSTSSGLKYSKLSPKGKFGFFGDGDVFNLDNSACAILKKDVENIIERAKENIRLEHIFKDCLKDELLSMPKVIIGKTRLFNTGPLDYQIAYKMYCGAFVKAVQDNMFKIGIAIGINPYTDWDLLFRKLTSRYQNAFAGDFTGWDMKLTPQFFLGVLEIMNLWYKHRGGTTEDDKIRSVLFAEVYNSLHQGLDGIYYWFTGNSSGHAATAMNNSLYNLLLFAYCARELTGRSLYEIADFSIYGDDNLFVTNELAFNLESCSVLLERFGMIYGTDTKDGTTYKYKSIYDCSFLKRKFVNSDTTILAPLDIHSVLTCLFYKKTKTETEGERLLKYFRQCCELSLHDKYTFDKYFQPIWDVVKDFSWIIQKYPTLYLTEKKQMFLRDLTLGFEYY